MANLCNLKTVWFNDIYIKNVVWNCSMVFNQTALTLATSKNNNEVADLLSSQPGIEKET